MEKKKRKKINKHPICSKQNTMEANSSVDKRATGQIFRLDTLKAQFYSIRCGNSLYEHTKTQHNGPFHMITARRRQTNTLNMNQYAGR